MSPAKKAVKTRKARKEFMARYGYTIFQAVSCLCKGQDSFSVASALNITLESVAAIKANLTRGTYDSALRGCNLRR